MGIPVCQNYNEGETIFMGSFKIRAFKVVHDVDCHGFIIHHPEMGKLVFLTDTHYSPFKFSGINHFCIEANYDQQILDNHVLNGHLLPVVRNRIMQSHMSIQTCKELLQANDLSQTRNIILLHLSAGNSNERQFKEEIEKLTGISTTIADAGVEVDLSLTQF
jgi:phosphoribosyl 1,2-cyclic phosphodiesterase